MTDEIPLDGGWSVDGVVRVGDTVRRPPMYATQLMRDVLVHLERVGFNAAPRWLGLDEQGRDTLSWIDGETFSDCREIVWSDNQLTAAARLLRRYHDAVAGSPLADGREVVCHGDFGPWNLIWRDALPAFVIDFDNAHPGDRSEDVGYALRAYLNLGLVDVPPSEQAERAHAFADAYDSNVDVVSAIEQAYVAAELRCIANEWFDELARLEGERGWFAENRAAF